MTEDAERRDFDHRVAQCQTRADGQVIDRQIEIDDELVAGERPAVTIAGGDEINTLHEVTGELPLGGQGEHGGTLPSGANVVCHTMALWSRGVSRPGVIDEFCTRQTRGGWRHYKGKSWNQDCML